MRILQMQSYCRQLETASAKRKECIYYEELTFRKIEKWRVFDCKA